MEQRNFYSALAHLNDIFGIEMKDEAFENIALHAWDHIGNKNYHLYNYRGECLNSRLPLPCNVDIIESVQGAGQDVHRATGEINDRLYQTNQYIENAIEKASNKGEALYQSGHFLDYTMEDNTLVFKTAQRFVSVLYKGVIVDDEGLPLLNFKEVDAIAKYCAYVTLQKEAMISKDKSTWEMSQAIKQQWQFACDDARTPIYLNQNEIDNILNVQSSWDRKRFGLSFKTIR